MDNILEFDSEFCNVRYIGEDNIVLLTWKKYACKDNYRKPTLFALDLLKKYPHSNFVVDARNGFEDEREDVEWGFSQLLPDMATTDCKHVVFIMEKESLIENEMDMWTKEFAKYFAVSKAENYEQAIQCMSNLILVNVKYTVKPGKRTEFLEKMLEFEIDKASKAEPGNYKYEYYYPVESENEIFLMEIWVNQEAIKFHNASEHYQKLQELKKEYVLSVSIDKFSIKRY